MTCSNNLDRAYRTANVLSELFSSIRGIHKQREVYDEDLNCWLPQVINHYNPLCALLSTSTSSDRDQECFSKDVYTHTHTGMNSTGKGKGNSHNHSHFHSISKREEIDRKKLSENTEKKQKLDCCSHLLSLGVCPYREDSKGRIPIVIAALKSDTMSLCLLQLMLSNVRNTFVCDEDHRSSKGEYSQREGEYSDTFSALSKHWLANEQFKYLIWHVLMACTAKDTSPYLLPSVTTNTTTTTTATHSAHTATATHDTTAGSRLGFRLGSGSSSGSGSGVGLSVGSGSGISKNFSDVLKSIKSKGKSTNKKNILLRKIMDDEMEMRFRGHDKCVEILLSYGFPGKRTRKNIYI